jgi:hypothetical protein
LGAFAWPKLVQIATMLILVLVANTAYADFRRLASILARDRYLPRQLMNQGDRLAFSNGIVGLSLFASLLLVVYGGGRTGSVCADGQRGEEHLRHDWDRWGQGVRLVVLDSPFRSLMEPFLEYIEEVDRDGRTARLASSMSYRTGPHTA